MSIFCTFICVSLFGQVDSSNNMNNMNPPTQTTTPTMNTTNNTNNINDSTTISTNNNTANPDSSKVVTPPATQGTMNMNATNSDMNNTNSNMNMNSTASNAASNLVNPNNIPGQVDYASLPVLETFVPQNIVDQVKQKFPNQVVYDITAVKAPVDSASMQNDSMMNHQNATAMNTDSSMSMNQNSTTTQNTMNMNQNGTNSNGMAMDTAQMPEKFDYVVRVLQNGQMTTETLASDGTAMLQPARPSQMNNQLNQ